MPSIHQDASSSNYRIRFRFQGRQIQRSLGTRDRRRAQTLCDRVSDMLALVNRGLVEVPAHADAIAFLLSDGRSEAASLGSKSLGITEFFATYQKRLPSGCKEESTLRGERLHVRHLQRHLGPNHTVQLITKAELQQYVAKRLKEVHRGRRIKPDTIRKELVTFRMLWNWGVEEGLLVGRSPTKHVELPLTDEKPPFMTRAEIEAVISRGDVSGDQQQLLWKSLFLEKADVSTLLEHVSEASRAPFFYPMLVVVAHTGTRRSEVVRSRIEDFDFRSRTVLIREKKKSRTKATTFRRVDMSPLVERVMSRWIAEHPGGHHVFCQARDQGQIDPVTIWQA